MLFPKQLACKDSSLFLQGRVLLRQVPDFTASKKRELPPVRAASQDAWLAAILGEIDHRGHNQAILLVCENPKAAKELQEFLECG